MVRIKGLLRLRFAPRVGCPAYKLRPQLCLAQVSTLIGRHERKLAIGFEGPNKLQLFLVLRIGATLDQAKAICLLNRGVRPVRQIRCKTRSGPRRAFGVRQAGILVP
jgi:hypothetical protein